MTAVAHVPHTFRNRLIGLTDAERVGRALLGKAVCGPDRLDITINLLTADGAVQKWERES
jgi:hypothetical protein